MKSIHLTLTGLTLSAVLTMLKKHSLPATYVGTDQSFNVIYEIRYDEEQEKTITIILQLISDFETFDNMIELVIEQVYIQYHASTRQKSEIKKPLGYSIFSNMRKFVLKHQEHENRKR